MVRKYTRLKELIAVRRKQTLAEWNKLIKSTLDEIDQEIREGSELPRDKSALFTFEGYQEWVRKLGEIKGWNIEGGWQNVETSEPSGEASNRKGWQKIHKDQEKS
jgi:hypothetical protein